MSLNEFRMSRLSDKLEALDEAKEEAEKLEVKLEAEDEKRERSSVKKIKKGKK